jgi:ABC-type nitrate/sulfonate/bicarbonate transport system substrate-binding protein
MKSTLRLFGILTLLVAHALPSCLADSPLVPVTMQLDWKPNVQFAGILMALEKGYYREAGLDVRVQPVDQEMKVVESVVQGTNWIGCSESGVLLGARAQGAPIKAVGTMLQGSPFCSPL